jgi:hypothetical protein
MNTTRIITDKNDFNRKEKEPSKGKIRFGNKTITPTAVTAFAILLISVSALSLFSASDDGHDNSDNVLGGVDTEFTVDNITYRITSDTAGQKHVTATFSTNAVSGNLTLDTVIRIGDGEEYTVKEIGNNAFDGRTGLTSVTMPNVTSIGNSAFLGCAGLKSIEIPNSVTSIGNFVFSGCTGLISIEIPSSVASIGGFAFFGCTGLTSVTMPNVTSIGNDAFKDCTGLTSVTMPNVTSIGNDAFSGCTGLKSIEIPNSVTSIGNDAFNGCTGLTVIALPQNLAGTYGLPSTAIRILYDTTHVSSMIATSSGGNINITVTPKGGLGTVALSIGTSQGGNDIHNTLSPTSSGSNSWQFPISYPNMPGGSNRMIYAALAEVHTVGPMSGTGYTLNAHDGSSSLVVPSGSFSFTLTIAEEYTGTPIVKANNTILTPGNDGVYTISDITENQTITVEGLSKAGNGIEPHVIVMSVIAVLLVVGGLAMFVRRISGN